VQTGLLLFSDPGEGNVVTHFGGSVFDPQLPTEMPTLFSVPAGNSKHSVGKIVFVFYLVSSFRRKKNSLANVQLEVAGKNIFFCN
jgi:hypothetical protein